MSTKDKQLTTVALGDILPKIDVVTAFDESGSSDTAPWSEKVSVEKYKELKESIASAAAGGILSTEKGVAGGVATLDSNGTVPSSQLPSYVDDVLEYTSQSEFPTTGETGKIYVDTTANTTYRWSGTTYVAIGSSLAIGETSSTAYAGDKGAATTATVNTLPSEIFTGVIAPNATTTEVNLSYKAALKNTVTNKYDAVYTASSVIPAATTATAGVMTANDKVKLDGLNGSTLTDAEKTWIEGQLFNSLFSGSISASPSSQTYNGSDYTVTFTLTTKYDGTLVDLDSVPSGWTKTGTGTYTKTATVSASTGSSMNSGSVSAVYNGNTKSIGAASCTNVKDSYILLSTKTALTTSDLDSVTTDGTKMNSGNSIAGDKTVSVATAGSYVYFIVANTSALKNVQQLGLDYLSDKTGTSLTRTNYGTYKVYRSANAMAVGTQTVTIS